LDPYSHRIRAQTQTDCEKTTHSRTALFGHRAARRPRDDGGLHVDSLQDNTTSGDGLTTLREAIASANAAYGQNEIQFAQSLTASGPKNISLSLGQLQISNDMIISGPGADRLTIDANGASRAFRISSISADVVMRDLAITGGNAIGGSGGAIGDSGSSLVLERMDLYGNHADVNGGAVSTRNFTMRDSIVRDNDADSGGGIYANALTYHFTVERSTIADNHAVLNGTGGLGGGIYVAHGTTTNNATIKDSTFDGNTADVQGGALYRSFGNLTTIQNSAFTRNHAGSSSVVGYGGGVFFEGSGPVNAVVTNSTFAENTADRGAAIDIRKTASYSSAASFLNSTIADNSAIALDGLGTGGGIRIQSGATVTLNNTIVARNSADNVTYANIEGTTSGSNNLIGGDPRLTPLGFYGGFTETLVPLIGSPALNAGSNSAASAAGLTLDQRGFARVVNGTVDIGAVEFVSPTISNGRIEIYGTAAADTITVTDSTLTYNGTTYNVSMATSVVIYGQGGNDIVDASAVSKPVRLYGEDGTDTLKGGSSADVLEGGIGNDTIYGGSGDDTYVFAGTNSLGTDTLFETASGGSDTLDFSALDYGIGLDIDLFADDDVFVSNGGKTLQVDLNYANWQVENVVGTIYNDRFADTKVIENSTIIGGLGNDTYVIQRGGLVNNQLVYSGNTTIVELPGQGSDTLDFSLMYAPINGISVDLSSNDPVQPVIGGFSLNLSNAAGLEKVIGTAKADSLTGNENNNWLQGGAGNDIYKFAGNNDQGHDTIFEAIGGGTDTIDFANLDLGAGVNFDLRTNTNNYEVINEDGKSLVLDLASAQLENLTGTKYADTLIGNTLANSINGGAGDDYIQGREGTDQLNGGTGNDIYNIITGQSEATDQVTDADGYTIQLPNDTTKSRPFIVMSPQFNLLGKIVATSSAPVTIARVSDVETPIANVIANTTVSGLDSADITKLPNGDIVWSPDAPEVGNSYQVTISVTDQQSLTNSFTFTASVLADADSDGDGLSDIDEINNVGSNPFENDTDGDQLPDGFEHASTVLDPLAADDPDGDHDGDGLSNLGEFAIGTNPDIWDTDGDGLNDLDGSDVDGDGLNYLDETAAGTNPNKFDTDFDLLSDRFEVENDLDPLDGDENSNDRIDSEDDFDDDGLSNLDEQIHGTAPTSRDTDADGSSDRTEAEQGSDPNDGADLGQAPPADELVNLKLLVGDFSGSRSERWNLVVGPVVHQAPGWGEVGSAEYRRFRKGETYSVTVDWRDTKPEYVGRSGFPDYDYSAEIALGTGENTVVIIDDPDDILRTGWYAGDDPALGGPNYPEGKSAEIYVPKVDLDITNPAVPDETEYDPGGSIQFNNDDDDADGILDYQDPTVAGENDLVQLTLQSVTPVDAQQLAGALTLTFSNSVRIWRSPNKTNEVISDVTEFDMSLSHTLYVERVTASGTPIEIEATYTPDIEQIEYLNPTFTVLGTETTDVIRLDASAVGGNLTAYRSMHGPNGSYGLFTKTAVAEANESSPTLGPGIRLNWDHDNGSSEQDRIRINSIPIPGENDLIEIRVDVPAGANNLVLEVAWNMTLFTSAQGGTPVTLTEHEAFVSRRTVPLAVTGGSQTFFVQWHGDHGIGDIKLVNANTENVVDTLKFHSFQSIVIGFSGETAGSFLGNMPYLEQPTYDIAVDFYNRGYDAYYYDVFWHSPTGAQPPGLAGRAVDDVLAAIRYRGVTHVGSFGWSHGGGATYLLMQTLNKLKDLNLLKEAFTVDATAYIDAVRYDAFSGTFNPFPEPRKPVLTSAHANWYQTNITPFQGTSVTGSDIDVDFTPQLDPENILDHVEVAIEVSDQELLLDFFEQELSTR
jgi:hypothetical protein